MTAAVLPASRTRPRARRVAGIFAVALVALSLSACASDTPDQAASKALDKGLQAHVAGNLDEAQKQYNECLTQVPTHKLCHYNLGLIAQTKGDGTTAEKEYRAALAADPAYMPAIFNLAILRTNAGDTTEAISLYTKYVAAKPDDAGGHLNLGLLLVGTGAIERGNEQIMLAITLDPSIKVPLASPAPSSAAPSAKPAPSATPK